MSLSVTGACTVVNVGLLYSSAVYCTLPWQSGVYADRN